MWHFSKARYDHSNTSPKLGDFFGAQDHCSALVRESVQNSLDARQSDDAPVRLKFTIKTIDHNVFSKYCDTSDAGVTVEEHTSSSDLGRHAVSIKGKAFRTLVVEDSGTIGLIGSVDKKEVRGDSNFVGFWWNEGISPKKKGGKGGSHGVGKSTITRISELSLFFAVTKRFDDDATYLLGFANLPNHSVNSVNYLGYGRYCSLDEQNRKVLPIAEKKLVNEFLYDFRLDRDDYGLSVVIPGVPESVDLVSLVQSTLKDYFWPILRGNLEVEFVDESKSEKHSLTKENIVSFVAGEQNTSQMLRNDNIAGWLSVALKAIELGEGNNPNWFPMVEPKLEQVSPRKVEVSLERDAFTAQNYEAMIKAFDANEMLGFEFNLPVEGKDGSKEVGRVRAFIQRTEIAESTISNNAKFIRRNILISNQKSEVLNSNVAILVVVDDEVLSDYLVGAEGPAHTDWTYNNFKSQSEYKNDGALRFVSNLPRLIYRLLNRDDEKEENVKDFAKDIFSIGAPKEKAKSKKSAKKKKTTIDPAPPPPPKRLPLIRIEKEQDGVGYTVLPTSDFQTLVGEEIHLPIKVSIKSAYMSVRGKSKSWSDYSNIDFDYAKDITVTQAPEGCVDIQHRNANELTFEIKEKKFKVIVTGFDQNRDLLIHQKTEVGE